MYRIYDKTEKRWREDILFGQDDSLYIWNTWQYGVSATEIIVKIGNPEDYVVVRSTGLKDKNGERIWEWDRLEYNGEIYIVRFDKLPLDKSGDCVCTYRAFYAENTSPNRTFECNTIADYMTRLGSSLEGECRT